jgi:hypothetical protein
MTLKMFNYMGCVVEEEEGVGFKPHTPPYNPPPYDPPLKNTLKVNNLHMTLR